MPYGRIRERELIIPALQAARDNGGSITTTELITKMTNLFQPTGEDAEIIEGRQDSKFSQKVRNLISHRTSSTSLFTKGYGEYDPSTESISITTRGVAFLDQVPE